MKKRRCTIRKIEKDNKGKKATKKKVHVLMCVFYLKHRNRVAPHEREREDQKNTHSEVHTK